MRNMIEETLKLHAIDWGIVSLIGGREEKFWQPCQRVFRGDFAPFFITDERTLGARNRVVYLFSYSILVLYSRALQFYQDRPRHNELKLILKYHSSFYRLFSDCQLKQKMTTNCFKNPLELYVFSKWIDYNANDTFTTYIQFM